MYPCEGVVPIVPSTTSEHKYLGPVHFKSTSHHGPANTEKVQYVCPRRREKRKTSLDFLLSANETHKVSTRYGDNSLTPFR